MMVMVTNSCGMRTGYLQGKHGGLGHLFSPGGQRGPYSFMPYALDNGRYPAWENETDWIYEDWISLLRWTARSGQRPLWALVPDVVGDAPATIDAWNRYSGDVASILPGVSLAFAAQDGMDPDDVPGSASVVFIGGTTEWKWQNLHRWTDAFGRVHVGRVNGYRGLVACRDLGVESVDGTGWFRGDEGQTRGLIRFLDEEANGIRQTTAFSR